METLSHILASFDIFQVLISSVPGMFAPLGHAFQTIFFTLRDLAGEQFTAHPGLITGTTGFLLFYLAWTGIGKWWRKAVPVAAPARNK